MLEGDVVVLALVTCITCSLKLAPVVAFLDALMVAAMGQVAGTDGLFDNVSEEQIAQLLLQTSSGGRAGDLAPACMLGVEAASEQAAPLGGGDIGGDINDEQLAARLCHELIGRAVNIAACGVANSPFAKRMYEERGTLCGLARCLCPPLPKVRPF